MGGKTCGRMCECPEGFPRPPSERYCSGGQQVCSDGFPDTLEAATEESWATEKHGPRRSARIEETVHRAVC